MDPFKASSLSPPNATASSAPAMAPPATFCPMILSRSERIFWKGARKGAQVSLKEAFVAETGADPLATFGSGSHAARAIAHKVKNATGYNFTFAFSFMVIPLLSMF
jgi:hypothetical protein